MSRPPRKIKLLYILDAFPDPQAGTEGQFWLLFSQLDRSRFEPAIVLLRRSAWLEEHVKDVPVHVLEVGSLRSPGGFWRILKAVRWARRERYRIAHIFFNDSAIVFPPLLKLVGIKVIVSRRDLGFWYTPANLRLLRLTSRFVDTVVANCEAVKRVVVQKEGFRAEQVQVIYNGIRRDESVPSENVRARLGLPPHARLLVLVANLRPLKRVDDAIRTLALLGPGNDDVQLLIVGEDRPNEAGRSHREELGDLAASLGVAQRVHFLGKMADPMPVIHAADICLLCSETEGLSNTIIEYMFAGKPVVCTDVGGNGELVEHDRTGIVVSVGNIQRMAEAIARLLTMETTRNEYGEHARQRANEFFSSGGMITRQSALYKALLPSSDTAKQIPESNRSA